MGFWFETIVVSFLLAILINLQKIYLFIKKRDIETNFNKSFEICYYYKRYYECLQNYNYKSTILYLYVLILNIDQLYMNQLLKE